MLTDAGIADAKDWLCCTRRTLRSALYIYLISIPERCLNSFEVPFSLYTLYTIFYKRRFLLTSIYPKILWELLGAGSERSRRETSLSTILKYSQSVGGLSFVSLKSVSVRILSLLELSFMNSPSSSSMHLSEVYRSPSGVLVVRQNSIDSLLWFLRKSIR